MHTTPGASAPLPSPTAEGTRPTGAALTVLLVEDNPGDARLIQEELREFAEHEHGAASALALVRADRLGAGLARLAAGGIDVVLLDLSLPDACGLETLASVRAYAPATPVLVLTGHDDEEVGARAVREGAQDYLVKGRAHGGVLRRAIRYAVERGRAQAEREALLTRERAARADADAASRAKSDFLAMMSHEIRTPINAIVGYTELLELGIAGPVTDAQRTHLARMRASSTHLIGLITEVLDLAKVEAGQLSVATERARIADAVTGALAVAAPQAAGRGILVTDHCGAACDAEYLGDEGRVRQILLNLLSNAVKFTSPGGHINVACGVQERPGAESGLAGEGPWLFVRVKDTGVGIPPDKLASVFEPFVQAETGHTRSRDGTGLGLTIARRLARLMGGDLTVTSCVGRGSTFTLWLPAIAAGSADTTAARPHASASRSLPSAPVGLARLGHWLTREVAGVTEAFVERLRGDPALRPARALSTAQLADHTATLLADVAQSLVVLEESAGQPSYGVEDGTAIQRLVAERHGAQRFRLGWSQEMLRREFQVLREEVTTALMRHGLASAGGTPAEGPLEVLARCIDQAEHSSLRRFREAAAASRA